MLIEESPEDIKININGLEDTIIEYQQSSIFIDPYYILVFSILSIVVFGLTFAVSINQKINNFKANGIKPTPLYNNLTVISWFGIFTSLSILLIAFLKILEISNLISILLSIPFSMITGIAMWNVISDLLNQIERGEVKEIDEFL